VMKGGVGDTVIRGRGGVGRGSIVMKKSVGSGDGCLSSSGTGIGTGMGVVGATKSIVGTGVSSSASSAGSGVKTGTGIGTGMGVVGATKSIVGTGVSSSASSAGSGVKTGTGIGTGMGVVGATKSIVGTGVSSSASSGWPPGLGLEEGTGIGMGVVGATKSIVGTGVSASVSLLSLYGSGVPKEGMGIETEKGVGRGIGTRVSKSIYRISSFNFREEEEEEGKYVGVRDISSEISFSISFPETKRHQRQIQSCNNSRIFLL
jgi:hypothetical protein